MTMKSIQPVYTAISQPSKPHFSISPFSDRFPRLTMTPLLHFHSRWSSITSYHKYFSSLQPFKPSNRSHPSTYPISGSTSFEGAIPYIQVNIPIRHIPLLVSSSYFSPFDEDILSALGVFDPIVKFITAFCAISLIMKALLFQIHIPRPVQDFCRSSTDVYL